MSLAGVLARRSEQCPWQEYPGRSTQAVYPPLYPYPTHLGTHLLPTLGTTHPCTTELVHGYPHHHAARQSGQC